MISPVNNIRLEENVQHLKLLSCIHGSTVIAILFLMLFTELFIPIIAEDIIYWGLCTILRICVMGGMTWYFLRSDFIKWWHFGIMLFVYGDIAMTNLYFCLDVKIFSNELIKGKNFYCGKNDFNIMIHYYYFFIS